jgi:hypothetical protein
MTAWVVYVENAHFKSYYGNKSTDLANNDVCNFLNLDDDTQHANRHIEVRNVEEAKLRFKNRFPYRKIVDAFYAATTSTKNYIRPNLISSLNINAFTTILILYNPVNNNTNHILEWHYKIAYREKPIPGIGNSCFIQAVFGTTDHNSSIARLRFKIKSNLIQIQNRLDAADQIYNIQNYLKQYNFKNDILDVIMDIVLEYDENGKIKNYKCNQDDIYNLDPSENDRIINDWFDYLESKKRAEIRESAEIRRRPEKEPRTVKPPSTRRGGAKKKRTNRIKKYKNKKTIRKY